MDAGKASIDPAIAGEPDSVGAAFSAPIAVREFVGSVRGDLDLYVAEFIGKANFVKGNLNTIDDSYAVVEAGNQVVRGKAMGSIPQGAVVRLMLRPENVQLSREPASGIAGTVYQVSYLGPATEYLVQCDLGLFRVLELRRVGSVPHAEGGARLALSWRREEALVYPELE